MATIADGVRKLGFRKWYERQLIESHLYLVTCFLCMIVVAASIEVLTFREGAAKMLSGIAAIGGGLAIGWLSWQRYRTVLLRAERLGEKSTCAACGVYGRFSVVSDGSVADEPWLKVQCRKCGHNWMIE